MDIDWTLIILWLVIAIAFMLIFRKSINQCINRIKSIGGKQGVDMEPQQSEKSPNVNSDEEAERLLNAFNSEMLIEQEEIIKNELKEKNINAEQANKVLIRHLAATQIAFTFENIHKQIWGSQIRVLEELNTQSNGLSRTRIKIYYDKTVEATPFIGTIYSFEQWINFIKNWALILEENNAVKITIRGREFLLYMTRYGLSKDLPN